MFIYSFDHSIRIIKYIYVGKAHNGKAQRLKIPVPFLIFFYSGVFIMLSAIYLYNEFTLRAVKVHNVIPDIFPPVELRIADLFSSDLGPEKLLGIGHVAS